MSDTAGLDIEAMTRRFLETALEAEGKTAKRTTGDTSKGAGGPRTEAGKRKSSRNALKHGIRSESVPPEEQEEFLEHCAALQRALEPEGFMEMRLAERAALTLWRLRRLERWEASLLGRGRGELGHLMLHDHELQTLQRYEAHLERVFYRAVQALEARKSRRRSTASSGG